RQYLIYNWSKFTRPKERDYLREIITAAHGYPRMLICFTNTYLMSSKNLSPLLLPTTSTWPALAEGKVMEVCSRTSDPP
ncbi:MAG: hypothetical protein ABFQ89_05605, partial [Chloroflexota bacterium]